MFFHEPVGYRLDGQEASFIKSYGMLVDLTIEKALPTEAFLNPMVIMDTVTSLGYGCFLLSKADKSDHAVTYLQWCIGILEKANEQTECKVLANLLVDVMHLLDVNSIDDVACEK